MRERVLDGKDSGIFRVPRQMLALGTEGGVGVSVGGWGQVLALSRVTNPHRDIKLAF